MNKVAILRIGAIVIVAPQSEIDDGTAIKMQDIVLAAAARQDVEGVVLDLSLVEMIDSYMVRLITDTARMIQLMGTGVCLSGLQPMVALTIVEMGLDFGRVPCELNVDNAVARIRDAWPDGSGRQ